MTLQEEEMVKSLLPSSFHPISHYRFTYMYIPFAYTQHQRRSIQFALELYNELLYCANGLTEVVSIW